MHSVLEHLNGKPGRGLVVAATLVLLVAACEEQLAPVACGLDLAPGPLPLAVGVRTTVTACFTDPNGDVLSYTATSANPGVATASAAGETTTVTAVSPGKTYVTITASDPIGLTGEVSFELTVYGFDLLFTEVTPRSVTVSPGDKAVAQFTAANSGPSRSRSTLPRLFQSDDTTITTSDTELLVLDALRPLDPSEEFFFNITINVPESFSPGNAYVGLCLDVVPGETNRDNNCSPAFTITVTASSTPAHDDRQEPRIRPNSGCPARLERHRTAGLLGQHGHSVQPWAAGTCTMTRVSILPTSLDQTVPPLSTKGR